ncbi:MAG: hypothetical protein DRN27_09945 [Thermoplasmata archaeon]|nr:MAG: hypothetical protein DRN27_09945 [Thermoplasmata archaeon]
MNRKKLNDWNSGTAHRILRRYPDGFIGYQIQGERGKGKSMYAYKVMAKVYMAIYNLDEYEAYDMALKYMIFSPNDLINLIEYNIKHDVITPVICLDDATVHFNSYKFFVDLYEVVLLKGLFDTIRTAITSVLITCPNRKQLLSFLRAYDDYKIEIKSAPGGDNYDRYARCYQFNWYPDERKYKVIVPFQDKYSCYVPGSKNDLTSPYGAYMAKRKKYLSLINEKMKKIMIEKEKRTGRPSVDPREDLSL